MITMRILVDGRDTPELLIKRLHRKREQITSAYPRAVIEKLAKAARQRIIEQMYNRGAHGKLTSRGKLGSESGHNTPTRLRELLHMKMMTSAKGTGSEVGARVWFDHWSGPGTLDLFTVVEGGAKPHPIPNAFGREGFTVQHPGFEGLHMWERGINVFQDVDYARITKEEFQKIVR